MGLPFGVFWVMLLLARKEIGGKGLILCALLGIGLLAGLLFANGLWALWVIGQVLLDVILILRVFGGDIRIN